MVLTMFIFPVNKTKVFLWHAADPARHFLSCWLTMFGGLFLQPDCKLLAARSPLVYFFACGFFPLPLYYGAGLIKQKTSFWWGTGVDLLWNECDFILVLVNMRACTCLFSLPDVVACLRKTSFWVVTLCMACQYFDELPLYIPAQSRAYVSAAAVFMWNVVT